MYIVISLTGFGDVHCKIAAKLNSVFHNNPLSSPISEQRFNSLGRISSGHDVNVFNINYAV